jgi:phage virion morphogenesis protein
MAAAVVSVDSREIKRLAAVLNRSSLDAGNRRRLMAALGAELEDQTKERFETKRSPEGTPWEEISEKHRRYLEDRFPGSQPPLVVGGELRDTVESQVSDWAVLMGATKVYAAVHQFSWDEKNIPARPYLGVGASDEESLVAVAEDFLVSAIRRAS